jgi:diguanylate cyclase (GGDEF)-like protein
MKTPPKDSIIGQLPPGTQDDVDMFALAPISLWLEDFSGVKQQLAQWSAAGIVDLRRFMLDGLEHIKTCSERIRIIKVNQKTLSLYEAGELADLIQNLDMIFRDVFETHVEQLVQMWEGKTSFSSQTVNYSLSGRRMDIQLHGTILPGYENDWGRVLLSIEDITEQESAKRQLAESDAHARGLFEHSPVSLWIEDFSAIKHLLDQVRSHGISDFRAFTDVHPEFIERCMNEIRVVDVNRQTLAMFAAPDKATLFGRLGEVFRDDMRHHFKEQLIDLWQGKLFQQREVANYTLEGDKLHVYLQFSVLPGHESDWDLVQVALTDITARKKAESYLEFLGKHDVLTKLHNRTFYVEELNRLERKGQFPVTVIILDLNNLKVANDQLGHAAGDELLRRAGEVLMGATEKTYHAARIGGDEFAVLMPATDERAGMAMLENIQKLIELNNQFYTGPKLSISIGIATGKPGERLEEIVRRADFLMYESKKMHYSALDNDRRDA